MSVAGPPRSARAPGGAEPFDAREEPIGTGTHADAVAKLRERLAVLSPDLLEIHDDSAEHAGHAGASAGGGHFSLLIVSEVFAGLPRLQRHQRVLRQVADLLPYPVHALSIKALTPDEFPSQP
jgi:BolA protein